MPPDDVICSGCGLHLAQSRLIDTVFYFHDAEAMARGDLMKALQCPLFGTGSLAVSDDPLKSEIPAMLPPEQKADESDIPALWRTTGHWNAVWARSK